MARRIIDARRMEPKVSPALTSKEIPVFSTKREAIAAAKAAGVRGEPMLINYFMGFLAWVIGQELPDGSLHLYSLRWERSEDGTQYQPTQVFKKRPA